MDFASVEGDESDQASDGVVDTCLKSELMSMVTRGSATEDNVVTAVGECTMQAKIANPEVVRFVSKQTDVVDGDKDMFKFTSAELGALLERSAEKTLNMLENTYMKHTDRLQASLKESEAAREQTEKDLEKFAKQFNELNRQKRQRPPETLPQKYFPRLLFVSPELKLARMKWVAQSSVLNLCHLGD
eukprot:TRINITY_DN25354_c0_g1_i1.p1 TRINITY_DN25354_c0_g1~~TRINITY_DN25354_c0_g1_i1.p1  ORF type:complete len:187 (-),score=37.47 TRINITY_DN25354_c0_g1_i1:31-591(-)